MKQSLIQPTVMMLCREPHKTVIVLPFEKLFVNFFFQLRNNFIRQGYQNVKMTMNEFTCYLHFLRCTA